MHCKGSEADTPRVKDAVEDVVEVDVVGEADATAGNRLLLQIRSSTTDPRECTEIARRSRTACSGVSPASTSAATGRSISCRAPCSA